MEMTRDTKQTAVRKHVVRLSEEERERLNTLIHAGFKHRPGRSRIPSRSLVHLLSGGCETVQRR
jgi:hypothetical protein